MADVDAPEGQIGLDQRSNEFEIGIVFGMR